MEHHTQRRQPQPSPLGGPPQRPLTALTERLRSKQQTRLALMFLDRFDGIHLKDITTSQWLGPRDVVIEGHRVVNFGDDSFLGLDRHPLLIRAITDALATWGTHNGASRAFTSVALYDEAEERLARWLDVESTLIYPSVTMANAALLPAIADDGDLLILDRQSHDSMHQAAKLAAANGAQVEILHSCDPVSLEKAIGQKSSRAGLVVAIDGMYSMTGIIPPLGEIQELVAAHGGVLYVDDAHGTGVVGPNGRGAAFEQLGQLGDILMVGSLSKAFSCLGAFVSCAPELKRILKVRSNSFVFSGPVPPPYLAAICAVCDLLESDALNELRDRLHILIRRLVDGAEQQGLTVLGGKGPIVSILIGDIERTLQAGRFLFDRGFYVQSATFPAVSITGGLLRILVNANHTEAQIDGLLGALAEMKTWMESQGRAVVSD